MHELPALLAEQARATSPLEAAAVLLAIAYLFLAIRQNIWCWLCAGIYTAIYELDGDDLKVCYRERERPTGFTTERGSMWTSHVLKRSNPDD